MTRLKPWEDREYSLYENRNNGTLRFLKDPLPQGPWFLLSVHEKAHALTRELNRIKVQNEFIGSLQGKTIVVMGCGPMVSRISTELAQHLIKRDDIAVCGVNSVPSIARRMWHVSPDALFDFVMAGDLIANEERVQKQWGWRDLKATRIFGKARRFDGQRIPINGTSSPTAHLPMLFWRDSIVGAINLAVMTLCQQSIPKYCGGPYASWPVVQCKGSIGGKIVLLGVELNRQDHAYTGDDRFHNYTNPIQEWPDIKIRQDGHRMINAHSKQMGVSIVNSAPWSMIKEYPFVDFEDFLGIPDRLRTGVTALGMPQPKETLV